MLQKNVDVHKKKEKHQDEANEYYRLKSRYESKPFHERNYALFRFATIGSWGSNMVSGITESAKVFAFIVGIIGSLAFGNVFAFILTVIAIIGIELIHRFIARSYFKEYIVNNGHVREQNGNLAGMIICLLISTGLSVAGQFDVLRMVMNPPQIAEVQELGVKDINQVLSPIVKDAKQRTENYYKRRNYKGRLAQEDKFKYREFESHAKAMEDSLVNAVLKVPQLNAKAKEEARKQYLADRKLYKAEVQTKGLGLIFITIPSILLMYLCLWFEENYLKRKKDYLEEKYAIAIEEPFHNMTAIHPTPIPTGVDISQLAQHLSILLQQPQQPKFLHNSIEEANAHLPNPSKDIYSEEQQKAKELLDFVARKKGDYPDDKYTILHFSFKNGKPKRYTKDRVDWFVKHYQHQVDIAEEEELEKEVELNRKSKLIYWQERQKELYLKLGVATA